MLGIGGTELVIILIFGFIIFGPEKLPQIGRTVGRAIRQFREASDAANQKFKEEVYDPFKEAVEPYADQIKEQADPLKEDLDAINSTLNETKEMFTDPFGTKGGPSKAAKGSKAADVESAGAQDAPQKAPRIKSMVDDMLHDPFDIKKDEKAAQDASVQASLDKADAIVEALESDVAAREAAAGEAAAQAAGGAGSKSGVQAQPLPSTGGKVKKGLAESLYDLDVSPTAGDEIAEGGE